LNANELVNAFAAARPRAAELAEVVSFAVLIDRPLLRQARMKFVPEADAGAEADLWLGPLVKSRSSEGVTFNPEVATVLRTRLAANAKRKDEAWELTKTMHAHLPPTLTLEEKINHLSIDDSAAAAQEIDELLSSVLSAMAAGGRDGLASWAARALENFPTSVRKRSTAKMLAAGASLRLGTDPRQAFGKDIPEWLRFVAPAQLPVETIGVQLAPGMLRVDATKNPSGQLLRLPATRPYIIDVWWNASDGQEECRQIALRAGDTQDFAVGAGEVRLRTVAGDTFQLRLGGTAQSDVWHYIIDFSEVLERAERGNANAAGSILNEGAPMTLITGNPGSGKTSTLAQIVRQASSSGAACAYHFFERGTPRLEYWEFAERSLIAQLMRRYAAPSWAVTMRLREFLDMIAPQVGTGPAYLVLDNVDVVQKSYTVSDVLGPLMALPPQFVIVTSATPSERLPVSWEAVRVVELPGSSEDAPSLPPPDSAARRYLQALAMARAPLPLPDAINLRESSDESNIDFQPWTAQRRHLNEPSIMISNDRYRLLILHSIEPGRERLVHSMLARAVGTEVAEQSWYGIRHAAWHELYAGETQTATAILTAPEWLERAVRLFGAAITLDIIEEVRNAADARRPA
jgi:hypothetical protein